MRKRPRLTEHQFDKWADSLKNWISESVSPFDNDSPEKQQTRKEQARNDILYFFKTYLPHYFNREFAGFHDEWADITEAKDDCFFLAAPREHAKSTWFSLGLPIWSVCFGLRKYILIISDTNDQATGFTLPIRMEFEENPRLLYDFGLEFGQVKKKSDYIIGESRILARGRGEKVRGLKHGPHRPDMAIADDCENDMNVQNPRLVKHLKNWLLQAVIGSLGEGFLFCMVGNLFHPKSVLSQFMSEKDDEGNPLYISKIYRAILDAGSPAERPLWPALWPMARLMRKRHLMGSRAFNAEMMNQVAEEDSPFKEEWFRYYNIEELPDQMICATFVDPSAKKTENSDYRAVITVGLNRETMNIHVLHARIRRHTLGEMFDAAYEHVDSYGGSIGIETNMFEDFLHQAIAEHARKKGRYLPWRPVRHSTNKITRIVGTLSYLVEHGKLLFSKGHSDQDMLVEQLIYINNATVNDDGPDALEGAVSLVQTAGTGTIRTGHPRKSHKMLKGYR